MGFFDVSVIHNSALNIPLNTYSLQDALNIPFNTYSLQDALNPNNLDSTQFFNGHITPYLFDTGCLVDGVKNCTAACQDPGSAFSNLTTLHNCMMYPVIADQYAKDNLSTDIVQLADSLGIEKEQWPSSSVSLKITKTISMCLDAYCGNLPYCTEAVHEYNERNYEAIYQYNESYYEAVLQYNESYYEEIHQYNESYFGYDSFLNQTGNFYFDLDPRANYDQHSFDLCTYLPVSVNQDIGGIGVRQLEH